MVERSPVDANTYRLAVINRHLHDRLEIFIAMLAPHIPWVDSVLREKRRCLRVSGEELMAVVVEVAHDRRREAIIRKPLHDLRDRRRSRIIVDGDAHKLAAGACQMRNLRCGTCGVGGIGVGHGLHHDRVRRTDEHAANRDARC